MNHLKKKFLNINYFNKEPNNHIIIGTNFNNDLEDSDKSLFLEDSHIYIPHLIEKFNCFNCENTDFNKENEDEENNFINYKGKDSKKIGVESFDAKTTIIEKKRNKCGRKRKGENNNDNRHDKFSDDNARRKFKRIVFSHLREYINKQIKIKYNGKIGKGIFKKELYTLKQEQISNSNVIYNILLLKKTLREIFSEKISGRIKNYPEDHNKIIIEGLINEKDEEKKIYFQNLFNLTFSDCLEYLRGDKYFEQLNGLELFSEFNEIKQKYLVEYKDGEEYVKLLKYYSKEYETIIKKKNPRKLSKNKEE